MIKTIAIDDELPALEIISAYCQQSGNVVLEKVFTETMEAFAWLEKNKIDLLFLDIGMPDISGLEFYFSLSIKPMVIFTTAHSEYAVDGFGLEAIDYLLKPYTYKRFTHAIRKADESMQMLSNSEKPLWIMMKSDYGLVKITLSDIIFIESVENYLKFYLINNKKIVIRSTTKGILEKLPPLDFIRVHRSFIVRVDKISHIIKKLVLIGGHEIPLGISYEEAIFLQFRHQQC